MNSPEIAVFGKMAATDAMSNGRARYGDHVKRNTAPPGMEDVVKKLKGKPDIDNPYAVAWSMYEKRNSDPQMFKKFMETYA